MWNEYVSFNDEHSDVYFKLKVFNYYTVPWDENNSRQTGEYICFFFMMMMMMMCK